MRRLLLVALVGLALAAPSPSLAADSRAMASRGAVPQPDARAFFVMNAANGEVLASKNAHARVPIASITKLMTVLVALKHLTPSETVTVTGDAAQVGESRIPLFRGER